MSYSGFELSSNDSAAENKESQFTDKFKYFCMKMYSKGSSNQGSQHIIFLWGGRGGGVKSQNFPQNVNLLIMTVII